MAWSRPPDVYVRYHAYGFPPGTVQSPGDLAFTMNDLAHALFVTGRAPGDRNNHGYASVYEWLHRIALVPAYLRRTYRARLAKSNLALVLDRSEKMALSYALGQAMTGIFCEEQLQVAHLMHVDRYAHQFGVQFGRTQRRADLFGRAPLGWVVAEAKGRSRGISDDLRETLEAQKRSVSDIDGTAPWLALGCVAHFPDPAGAMQLDVFDPDKTEIEAVSFPVTLDQFILAYYLPFLRAIEMGTRTDGDFEDESSYPTEYTTVSFDQQGVQVGMSTTLVDRVRRAEGGELTGLYEDVQNLLAGLLTDAPGIETDGRVFRDGVTIATAWEQALSLRDWGLSGESVT